jgi:hypothetical protein
MTASENTVNHFVRWSDEDQCYIGYWPDLYFGGVCHGDSDESVYAQLCGIIRDEIIHRLASSAFAPTITVNNSLFGLLSNEH